MFLGHPDPDPLIRGTDPENRGDTSFTYREFMKKKKKYHSSLLGYHHPILVVGVKEYCLVFLARFGMWRSFAKNLNL
jgi:hypothetical protein